MVDMEYDSDEGLETLAGRISNWGRWGADDQLGTLNHITPAVRARAASEIQTGEMVSLARPLVLGGGDPDQSVQAIWHLLGPFYGASEFIGMAFHGVSVTHLDALCHIYREGKTYNGYPSTTITPRGARKLGVEKCAAAIAGRGVLLDLGRLRGERVPDGEAVHPEELEAAESRHGVKVGSGDLLLVRFGVTTRVAGAPNPGFAPSCFEWFHRREVALLGNDVASEVNPHRAGSWSLRNHQLAIWAMGMPLIDNARLDELGEACARLGRWSFFLSIAPLRIVGGTGSPVNPQAIF